jgi:hypothetical protein
MCVPLIPRFRTAKPTFWKEQPGGHAAPDTVRGRRLVGRGGRAKHNIVRT